MLSLFHRPFLQPFVALRLLQPFVALRLLLCPFSQPFVALKLFFFNPRRIFFEKNQRFALLGLLMLSRKLKSVDVSLHS